MEQSLTVAICDPVRLYAQPVGFDGDRWKFVAEGADGSRLTIVTSRQRFADALMPKGLSGVASEAEQIRAMFVRDEIDVEQLEQAVERELRQ